MGLWDSEQSLAVVVLINSPKQEIALPRYFLRLQPIHHLYYCSFSGFHRNSIWDNNSPTPLPQLPPKSDPVQGILANAFPNNPLTGLAPHT